MWGPRTALDGPINQIHLRAPVTGEDGAVPGGLPRARETRARTTSRLPASPSSLSSPWNEQAAGLAAAGLAFPRLRRLEQALQPEPVPVPVPVPVPGSQPKPERLREPVPVPVWGSEPRCARKQVRAR
jgi:hypothetical protein